jgi:hypothetical protein
VKINDKGLEFMCLNALEGPDFICINFDLGLRSHQQNTKARAYTKNKIEKICDCTSLFELLNLDGKTEYSGI